MLTQLADRLPGMSDHIAATSREIRVVTFAKLRSNNESEGNPEHGCGL